MSDDDRSRPRGAQTCEALPLFYRKKVGVNGESEEISLGPCAVCIVRWVIGVIAILVLLSFGGADPSVILRAFLELF
jgi:hypothetical protein